VVNGVPLNIRSSKAIPPCSGEKFEVRRAESNNCITFDLTLGGQWLKSVKLHKDHVEKVAKLHQIYKERKGDGPSRITLDEHIFVMLLRYASYFGQEGSGLHAALPSKVFEVLHGEFGVELECYASPLNCYFPSYCSAFFDTDHSFGSYGSFLKFFPTEGSFAANPPFTEEMLVSPPTFFLFSSADPSTLPSSFRFLWPIT